MPHDPLQPSTETHGYQPSECFVAGSIDGFRSSAAPGMSEIRDDSAREPPGKAQPSDVTIVTWSSLGLRSTQRLRLPECDNDCHSISAFKLSIVKGVQNRS